MNYIWKQFMPLFLLLNYNSTIDDDALNHFSTRNFTWFRLSFFNQNSVYISANLFCTQEPLYQCSTLLFKKRYIDHDSLYLFFSHNTKLQKYAYFQITVFTYYLQYISIVFSFALIFLPFLLYITLFLPCTNSVGSISVKPQAYLMKLHSMCMP